MRVVLRMSSKGRKEEDTLYLFPSHRIASRNGVEVLLPSLPYKILLALMVRQGASVSSQELYEWLYGDDPDGGPISNTLSPMLVLVRDAALCLGFDIVCEKAKGYFVEDFPKGGAAVSPRAHKYNERAPARARVTQKGVCVKGNGRK